MGFHLFKSKDKNTSSELSGHSTRTSGPSVARTTKGGSGIGSGTYAEKGGRAAATSHHGSAWSKSVAYGGNADKGKSSKHHQVSSRQFYTYTSGNAVAGVIPGGSYAYAGPGGYAEAGYRDGSRFGASVACGGKKNGKKQDAIQFR